MTYPSLGRTGDLVVPTCVHNNYYPVITAETTPVFEVVGPERKEYLNTVRGRKFAVP